MKNPWIFCGIFCAAVVLLAAAAVLWYRRRMKDTFRRISESLDEAIAGRYLPVTYEESWFSAVRRKLNRVLDIAGNAVARNAKDRRAIQELVSDISHQTKTPLANILLYAQLLCEQEGTPGPGAPLSPARRILQQGEKLDFLLKTLLRASYLENGMIRLNVCRDSVDDLIRLAWVGAEGKAGEKAVRLRYEGCGAVCAFDRKWTREALENILDNAVKYSPEGSEIFVNVQEYEMLCRIDVRDQGIGIPEEEQGRIFTRFYRSSEVSAMPGLGIGLYLAREIVTLGGGFLKVSSQKGEGSVFSIYLPKEAPESVQTVTFEKDYGKDSLLS